MPVNRITIIVLDSVGIGALPDAAKYGDEGSNTLSNIAAAVGGLNLPNLEALGLANCTVSEVKGVPSADNPLAAFGRAAEKSPGKDTTTGHWEISGLFWSTLSHLSLRFSAGNYRPFEAAINRKVLWNAGLRHRDNS